MARYARMTRTTAGLAAVLGVTALGCASGDTDVPATAQSSQVSVVPSRVQPTDAEQALIGDWQLVTTSSTIDGSFHRSALSFSFLGGRLNVWFVDGDCMIDAGGQVAAVDGWVTVAGEVMIAGGPCASDEASLLHTLDEHLRQGCAYSIRGTRLTIDSQDGLSYEFIRVDDPLPTE